MYVNKTELYCGGMESTTTTSLFVPAVVPPLPAGV